MQWDMSYGQIKISESLSKGLPAGESKAQADDDDEDGREDDDGGQDEDIQALVPTNSDK